MAEQIRRRNSARDQVATAALKPLRLVENEVPPGIARGVGLRLEAIDFARGCAILLMILSTG